MLVSRDGGLQAAEATITADNEHRPHLAKVTYAHSRTGAWIARARIVRRADTDARGNAG